MQELMYPFDSDYILTKKKRIKRALLNLETERVEKRIAILGGSTTSEIKNILEIFLLNYGISPVFYESEYNKYYEDAVFENKELDGFKPDIVFIHTTNKNIQFYPSISDTIEIINNKIENEYNRFLQVWESIRQKYGCIVIQNNFDFPNYRLLGNMDATDIHGRINYLTRLNLRFAEYAVNNDYFFINDINYQSSQFGLDKWADPSYWFLYKYALAVPAIPILAFNIANIIKSLFGKNKKALVLDLDNTLWGGVVGDDGVDGLEIGSETARGEAYYAFQEYVIMNRQIGALLSIDSKNDIENALAGIDHPDNIIKKDDFIIIKSNWEPKSTNLIDISQELNIGLDSLVFIDDNPAEREIVKQQLPDVSVPEIGDDPELFIQILDHNGFFECTGISSDDISKTEMYHSNKKRIDSKKDYGTYEDYLKSLEMVAEIRPFSSTYLQRITQLTNKSNQFNLTTRRYTYAEIESIVRDKRYITLYGKLSDKFGDNGVVSVIIGRIDGKKLEIDLWLMSCRVLKRDMEYAMMDSLNKAASKHDIDTIFGYYYPTPKNKIVKDFYRSLGFIKLEEDEKGNSKWLLNLKDYQQKNKYIVVEDL